MPNPYRKGKTVPYRSLDATVWAILNDLPPDPLRLMLHLWFSHHSSPFGVLDLPDAYILHDLNWRAARLRRAWALLEEKGLVLRDGRLIALPLFLACNLPSNPNVLAGWLTARNRLGESPIFAKLYRASSAYVTEEGLAWLQSKANTEPTLKAFPKPSPTLSNSGAGAGGKREEQEQEEGEHERKPAGARSASPPEAASLAPHSGNGQEPDAAPSSAPCPSPAGAGLGLSPGNGNEPKQRPERTLENLRAYFLAVGQDEALMRRGATRAGYSEEQILAVLAVGAAGDRP
jgi:hypothetical protein